jgi:hypothetical protein
MSDCIIESILVLVLVPSTKCLWVGVEGMLIPRAPTPGSLLLDPYSWIPTPGSLLLSPIQLARQCPLRIVSLAHIQATLLAILSPVEIPVWTPLCAALRVSALLQLEDAPTVVMTLKHRALLKLLASTLDRFANPIEPRSAQAGDGFDEIVELVGVQEGS